MNLQIVYEICLWVSRYKVFWRDDIFKLCKTDKFNADITQAYE